MKNCVTKTLWAVETYTNDEGMEKSYWSKVGEAVQNEDGTWLVTMKAGKFEGNINVREKPNG